MDSINRLTELFRDFPGIGPRQAKRFVYFLLTRNSSYLDELARLILDIKKSVRTCPECFRFFTSQSQAATCPTCINPNRDRSILMIVSRDVDFEAIEKSHVFNGLYFILGGSIPLLEKEPERRIRSHELATRIKRDSTSGALTEVILSLNANTEGEHTADVVRSLITEHWNPSATAESPKITVLGRGLSTGTELEYSDSDTIKSAFLGRH